jgi:hypothetical protein
MHPRPRSPLSEGTDKLSYWSDALRERRQAAKTSELPRTVEVERQVQTVVESSPYAEKPSPSLSA